MKKNLFILLLASINSLVFSQVTPIVEFESDIEVLVHRESISGGLRTLPILIIDRAESKLKVNRVSDLGPFSSANTTIELDGANGSLFLEDRLQLGNGPFNQYHLDTDNARRLHIRPDSMNSPVRFEFDAINEEIEYYNSDVYQTSGSYNLNNVPKFELSYDGIYWKSNPVKDFESVFGVPDYQTHLVGLKLESPQLVNNFAFKSNLVIYNKVSATSFHPEGFGYNLAGDILLTTLNGNIVIDPESEGDGGLVIINGSVYNGSDRKLKKNIIDLKPVIADLKLLKPQSYLFRKSGRKDFGFIAQDIQKVYPELVTTIDTEGTLGVNYIAIIPVLTKAIQEQQVIIDRQEKEIREIQKLLKKHFKE